MRKIFKKIVKSKDPEPKIMFGRYSDAYKGEDRYDQWDLAIELYDTGRYIESIRSFLYYLRNEELQNVILHKSEQQLHFIIYQGSKRIEGSIQGGALHAFSNIVQSNFKEKELFVEMLEKNYYLKYTRFSLTHEGILRLSMKCPLREASPYYLFYCLRELSVTADREDDLILHSYPTIQRVDSGHIREITENEKKIKYDFFIHQIQTVLNILNHTPFELDKHPGAGSYLLLSTLFKIDFLVKPEGVIMETIRESQRNFFQSSPSTAVEKMDALRLDLESLLNVTYENFIKELYEVVFTFGVTAPAGREELKGIIFNELNNINYYEEGGYDAFALAITDYIAGYCLYYYSLLSIEKDLLLLYFKIREASYFYALGYHIPFWEGSTLKLKQVKNEIKRIKLKYKYHIPGESKLEWKTSIRFYASYIAMIASIRSQPDI
ncbi:MAG TPA: hypothetical protein PKC30_00185 [Saprospiraceae bacterium]|nr:hypothetical protein [Saprospiraceae bacterium]